MDAQQRPGILLPDLSKDDLVTGACVIEEVAGQRTARIEGGDVIGISRDLLREARAGDVLWDGYLIRILNLNFTVIGMGKNASLIARLREDEA